MRSSMRKRQKFANWVARSTETTEPEKPIVQCSTKALSAAKQRRAARLNHEKACAHKSKGAPSTTPRNGMSSGEVDVFACSETLLQRTAA